MKYILSLICLLFLNASAFAWSQMECTGRDTTGKGVTLRAAANSSYVNINGDILQIVGKTVDGTGVVTENFLAVSGVYVYDSIVPLTNNSLNIYQFNAVTQKLLAQAYLTCRFSGPNADHGQVREQTIFKALK